MRFFGKPNFLDSIIISLILIKQTNRDHVILLTLIFIVFFWFMSDFVFNTGFRSS